MAERIRKKDNKKCGVCGDRALGSNFNAITCESCKAFFRRNALKTKAFKCPFENNCKVDMITRRFCQKCRLVKCFTIGMKKEWIMSEEEKKMKRDKIEKNRQKRKTQSPQEFTYIKTESLDDAPTLMSPSFTMSPLTPQTPGSVGTTVSDSPKGRVFVHQPLTPPDSEYSPPGKAIRLESALDSLADGRLSDDSSHLGSSSIDENEFSIEMDNYESSSAKMENGNSITQFNFDELSADSDSNGETQGVLVPKSSLDAEICPTAYAKAIEIEFTELPIKRSILKSNELNSIEKSKLEELVTANEVLKLPLACGLNDPSLLDVINMTDHAIRRLIKMSKRIIAFKNLCQEDQIALLKGGCTELMLLRSVMQYIPEKECWQGPQGPKTLSIKVDILKEAKGNLYEVHKRFLTSFYPEWRSDDNIMLILHAIALFTPGRPNTVHKEAIKLEQDTYYYLLRRYLDSKYGFCEAKSVYLKLIQKIQELNDLNENHVRVYLDQNPKEVEPLLIEIFDLKH